VWDWSRTARVHTHPLLVRLVDGVQGIFDGDALDVACCDFQAKREVQVDLLDWRRCEELLEGLLVLYCCGRGIDLPGGG